jgi:hypothetical protein
VNASDVQTEARQPERQPKRRLVRPATIVIGAIFVVLGVMWIYAWFFAPTGQVDQFHDAAWSSRAESICTTTRNRVADLPSAFSFKDVQPKSLALEQRAGVLDQVTALLRTQIADLRSVAPTDAKARKGVTVWLADWDGYLASRDAQAARMRAGIDEPFTVKEEGGAPVTLRMDEFATTNGMPDCIVPDDIG